MGNKPSQIFHKFYNSNEHEDGSNKQDRCEGEQLSVTRKQSRQYRTAALQKLFEKLELTADGQNAHPGELTKATFENAFSGPLHKFGQLLFTQMTHSSSNSIRDRITKEQFIKAGKEIMDIFDEKSVVKYYFHLFASGKDHLTPESAKQMFEVSFSLTLSVSKIKYVEDERDGRVMGALVTSLFGIETKIHYDKFCKWLDESCKHLFYGVHNWVIFVLTGSTLPEEMEMARVPQLEGVTGQHNCTSMAILWVLSVCLPPIYTRGQEEQNKSLLSAEQERRASGADAHPSGGHATKDPMWTSMLLLRKMARLPQVQGWTLLYNSDQHGLSINRFNTHVTSYHAPNVTFLSFEGRNLYCLAVDRGWVEGPKKFGGEDCRLIQLLPVFRVVQAGANMVRWNENSRGIPKGIQVGCDGKSEVLNLPQDFDVAKHYGVSCGLNKLEVWGCGSESALTSQKNQRNWELKQVRREQGRKLRLNETWEDSPDKQLLQWHGVNVGNHSYDR
ncbi:hypothetical protein PoB_002611000 [Plakobranchus ocellatus]|uniref:TLDc domain-containing protein n=1 Tax=Plakobranchus ocellatus TaxID=259542 RepID=A0AAV3ZUT2_9GAST|nr:hypothetical protein PoB_002611000 [Plakobranchus ocellatus]